MPPPTAHTPPNADLHVGGPVIITVHGLTSHTCTIYTSQLLHLKGYYYSGREKQLG